MAEKKKKIEVLDEQIGTLENQYGSRQFSYNPEADKGYQDYVRLMRENGKAAMEDTVGKMSALTGGYGNSWAASAGQQAYNQDAKQAAEAQATYRQLARSEFDAENQDILNRLNMLKQQKSGIWDDAALKANYGDYSGYVNELGLYESEEEAKKALGATPNDAQIEYAKKIFASQGQEGLNQYIESLDVGNADSLFKAVLSDFSNNFKVTDKGGKNWGGGLNYNANLSLNEEEHSVGKWKTILVDKYGFTEDEAIQFLKSVQDKSVEKED